MLHQGKLSQHQRASWWQAIYRCMALAALVHSDAYPLLPVEASEYLGCMDMIFHYRRLRVGHMLWYVVCSFRLVHGL